MGYVLYVVRREMQAGQRFRVYRQRRGLTQFEAAKLIGVSYQRLTSFELGILSPRSRYFSTLLRQERIWALEECHRAIILAPIAGRAEIVKSSKVVSIKGA